MENKSYNFLCAFCCKYFATTTLANVSLNFLHKRKYLNVFFSVVMKRHFRLDFETSEIPSLLNTDECCDDCFEIMEKICNLYHDFKLTELLLNYQMSIFLSKLRNPSARNKNQVLLEKLSNCQVKSYPKLVLEKYNTYETNDIKLTNNEDEDRLHEDISTDVILDKNVKLEFTEEATVSHRERLKIDPEQLEENEISDVHDDEQCGPDQLANERLPSDTTERRFLRQIFRCGLCAKTFSSSCNFETHMKNHEHDHAHEAEDADNDEKEPEKCEPIEDTDDPEFQLSDQLSEIKSRKNVPVAAKKKKRKYRPLKSAALKFDQLTLDRLRQYGLDKHLKKAQKLPEKQKKIPADSIACSVSGCPEQFRLQLELENHLKLHGDFPCSKCHQVYKYAPALVEHLANSHCEKLSQTAAKEKGWRWKESRNKSKTTQIVQCLECSFSFVKSHSWKKRYMKHVFKQHLNLPWVTLICDICGQSFFASNRDERRNLRHGHFRSFHDVSKMSPEEIHKCGFDQCSAYFRRAVQLHMHRENQHGSQTKFACQHCDQVFKTRDSRKRHLASHHNVQPSVKCKVAGCTTKLEDETDLVYHLEFHHHGHTDSTKTKNFECEKCGKILYFHSHYKQHIASHENELAHVCEQCGKRFQLRDGLAAHQLSHSGPDSWQFCCDVCGRKFMSKQKLLQHGRTHSKEKPFKCKHCEQKYAHRHNLRIHVNKKHADVEQDIPRHFDKRNLTSRKRT